MVVPFTVRLPPRVKLPEISAAPSISSESAWSSPVISTPSDLVLV